MAGVMWFLERHWELTIFPASLAMDRIYVFHLRLRVGWGNKSQKTLKAHNLTEHSTIIMAGENSKFAG